MILNFLGESRHRTDKAKFGHNYLNWYESFLSSMRDKPITVLEIGVFGGESLRMWRDYFQRARIVGMDIDPNCEQYAGNRIEIVIGNSGNETDLARAAAEGPFSLINDDGGHNSQDQILAFTYLLSSVRSGGYYILEDVMEAEVAKFCSTIAYDVLMGRCHFPISSAAFYKNSFMVRVA